MRRNLRHVGSGRSRGSFFGYCLILIAALLTLSFLYLAFDSSPRIEDWPASRGERLLLVYGPLTFFAVGVGIVRRGLRPRRWATFITALGLESFGSMEQSGVDRAVRHLSEKHQTIVLHFPGDRVLGMVIVGCALLPLFLIVVAASEQLSMLMSAWGVWALIFALCLISAVSAWSVAQDELLRISPSGVVRELRWHRWAATKSFSQGRFSLEMTYASERDRFNSIWDWSLQCIATDGDSFQLVKDKIDPPNREYEIAQAKLVLALLSSIAGWPGAVVEKLLATSSDSSGGG